MKKSSDSSERTTNKKNAILDAAEDCLNEYGLQKTNMRMIAKKAKVSLGTINYFFSSKNQILMYVFKRFIANMRKEVPFESPEMSPTDRLSYLFNGLSNANINKPYIRRVFMDLWAHTANSPELKKLMHDYYRTSFQWTVDLIEEGNKAGEFHVSDPKMMGALIFSLIDGMKVELQLLGLDWNQDQLWEKILKPNIAKPTTVPDTVKEMFDLTGKVAIVNATAGGLGASLAQGLAEAGARTVLCTKNKKKAVDPSQKPSRPAGEVFVLSHDLKIVDEVKALAEETLSRFGKIDILINIAGPSLEKMTAQEQDKKNKR